MGNIYMISGPCGCGKSTFTDALAQYMVREEKRNQVYVIHGDHFHHGFVLRSYEEEMFWENGQAANQLQWMEILRFNWECILDVSAKVLDRGLDVIIDYVVEDEMPLLLKLASDHGSRLYYIVLTASEEAITERMKNRGDIEMTDRALFLKKKLDGLPENQGHLYDNTAKPNDEAVAEIAKGMEAYLFSTESPR